MKKKTEVFIQCEIEEATYQAHKQEIDFNSDDPTIYLKKLSTPTQQPIEIIEGWISVEDRLPETKEYGTPDLMVSDRVLCITHTGLIAVGFLNNKVWIFDAKHNDFKRYGYTITHWKSLPPKP